MDQYFDLTAVRLDVSECRDIVGIQVEMRQIAIVKVEYE
jgi:hypothetical protein